MSEDRLAQVEGSWEATSEKMAREWEHGEQMERKWRDNENMERENGELFWCQPTRDLTGVTLVGEDTDKDDEDDEDNEDDEDDEDDVKW